MKKVALNRATLRKKKATCRNMSLYVSRVHFRYRFKDVKTDRHA